MRVISAISLRIAVKVNMLATISLFFWVVVVVVPDRWTRKKDEEAMSTHKMHFKNYINYNTKTEYCFAAHFVLPLYLMFCLIVKVPPPSPLDPSPPFPTRVWLHIARDSPRANYPSHHHAWQCRVACVTAPGCVFPYGREKSLHRHPQTLLIYLLPNKRFLGHRVMIFNHNEWVRSVEAMQNDFEERIIIGAKTSL